MSDILEPTRPRVATRETVMDLTNLLLFVVAVIVALVGLFLGIWANSSLDGLAMSSGFNAYGLPIMMFSLLTAGLMFMVRHPRK